MTDLASTQTAPPPALDLLHQAIAAEVSSLKEGEARLNRGYARLAKLLTEAKRTLLWEHQGFPSFNRYILSLVEWAGRSHVQLHAYVSAAELLLPYVGENGLDRMGISKAMVLVQAARKAKQSVKQELVVAALDEKIGVEELRARAHVAYNFEPGDAPKGTYLNMGGFYATDEERALMKDFYRVMVRVLGIPKESPDWLKLKRCWLAAASECVSTYAAEAFGKQDA